MYLIRRTPLRWGGVVQHTPLNAYLSQALGIPAARATDTVATLPLDIRQTEDAYVIEASVPGFSPEQVQVTVDQNWLVIHADRNQESETTDGGWVRRERRSASVHRRLALPEEVDAAGISAKFSNGELSITVPRSPRTEPRRVPVTAAAVTEPVAVAPETGEAAEAVEADAPTA
jgi:HSP20 family protein